MEIIAKGPKKFGAPEGYLYGRTSYDDLTRKTLDLFNKLLNDDRIQDLDDISVFGSYLYRILFNGKIGDTFEIVYRNIRNTSGCSLRIVLEFEPKAKKLAKLPWEFTYVPDTDKKKGYFIGAKNKLILSRHVPLDIIESDNIEEHLRILLVVSQPKDQHEVLWKPVFENIQNLETSFARIKVEPLENTTKSTFENKINDFKPHIVHFIGHGRWKKADEAGEIAFIDENDPEKTEWISDSLFSDFFEDVKPCLIFLHACELAKTETIEDFRGLALKLVYAEIPTVVAMQYPIENRIAVEFATKFYESLSEGKEIDFAVQTGRTFLRKYLKDRAKCRSFGIPVVYSRQTKGLLSIETSDAISRQSSIETIKYRPMKCLTEDCNNIIQIEANFCWACGRVIIRCEKCKADMLPAYKVCSICGNPNRQTISSSQVRKQFQFTKTGERSGL